MCTEAEVLPLSSGRKPAASPQFVAQCTEAEEWVRFLSRHLLEEHLCRYTSRKDRAREFSNFNRQTFTDDPLSGHLQELVQRI